MCLHPLLQKFDGAFLFAYSQDYKALYENEQDMRKKDNQESEDKIAELNSSVTTLTTQNEAFEKESEKLNRDKSDLENRLAERQQAFIVASAAIPKSRESAHPRMPWTPQGAALDAMRATHAKAYAPWTKADDLDLRRRHEVGETIDAIATAFGRKPGAIRSRLKKLALI